MTKLPDRVWCETDFHYRKVRIFPDHSKRICKVFIDLEGFESLELLKEDFKSSVDRKYGDSPWVLLKKQKTGDYKLHFDYDLTNLTVTETFELKLPTYVLRGALDVKEWEYGQLVRLQDREGRRKDFQHIPRYYKKDSLIRF